MQGVKRKRTEEEDDDFSSDGEEWVDVDHSDIDTDEEGDEVMIVSKIF